MSAFHSWQAVWHMGGDGFYVWFAYAIAVLLMLGQVVVGAWLWHRVKKHQPRQHHRLAERLFVPTMRISERS